MGVREWGLVVGRKYILRVKILGAAMEFNDLYAIRSLRLHELKGPRKGQHAVILHGRWRLVLVRLADDKVRVEEVTKHYGD